MVTAITGVVDLMTTMLNTIMENATLATFFVAGFVGTIIGLVKGLR